MGKLTKYLVPLIKFIVGAVVVGGAVYLWRTGRLSGWGEAEKSDQGEGTPPGRLYGLVNQDPGFGKYEVAIGAGAMTALALTAFALKKMGLTKWAPQATPVPVVNVG